MHILSTLLLFCASAILTADVCARCGASVVESERRSEGRCGAVSAAAKNKEARDAEGELKLLLRRSWNAALCPVPWGVPG